MGVSQDVFSLINALPEAVLIVDRRRGKFAGGNAVFSELMGASNNPLLGTQIFDLPFSTKRVKHELLRLFVKVSRDAGYNKTYSFHHVSPDASIKNISASARKIALGDGEYIVFTLRKEQSEKVQLSDSDSWNFYMQLASEPYMEFRPVIPVPIIGSPDSRVEFLQMLGEVLRVKYANKAAAEFYFDKQGTLEGKSFISLFNRESDAIGFLDMLSVVGHMKGETAVNTNKALGINVEMDCVVRFDNQDDIAALYCNQRDLSSAERYKAIIGGSKFETDFMFHQPFVGFAFLAPSQPLERPPIENLDAKLDEMLDQILIVRANQTIIDIYGSDKSKFFMKPMRGLFSEDRVARQVLKELFVMRETSSGWPSVSGDDFELVSVFRAVFDNADRLSGVLVVSSVHGYGYRPRHSLRRAAGYYEGYEHVPKYSSPGDEQAPPHRTKQHHSHGSNYSNYAP